MASSQLSCKEMVELVTNYLEGALSSEERDRFEHHLTDCRDCTAHIAQMHETLRLLGKLSEEVVSAPATTELLQAFRNWKSE